MSTAQFVSSLTDISQPASIPKQARPKIGLPPSAWAPDPLSVSDHSVTATSLVAMPQAENPWNIKFALALMVLLVVLNFSLGALFSRLDNHPATATLSRLQVIRSEDMERGVSPSGTGIYRHGASSIAIPTDAPVKPTFSFSTPGFRAEAPDDRDALNGDIYVSTSHHY